MWKYSHIKIMDVFEGQFPRRLIQGKGVCVWGGLSAAVSVSRARQALLKETKNSVHIIHHFPPQQTTSWDLVVESADKNNSHCETTCTLSGWSCWPDSCGDGWRSMLVMENQKQIFDLDDNWKATPVCCFYHSRKLEGDFQKSSFWRKTRPGSSSRNQI